MKLTWVYNKSFKVQCFGSNPNLRKALSSTDHAIKGASSANREGRIATFSAKNIQQIEVDSTKTSVLSCYFSTSTAQPMLTLTEVKFDLDSAGTVEIYYVLDEEEMLYVPTETYSEAGLHTLSLMYPVQVDELNVRHKFEVKMKTSSGLTIEPEDARIYIQGTGYDLTAGWDGYIVASDFFTIVDFGYMEPITFSESVVIDAAIPNTKVQVSDTIGEYSFSTLEAVSISETVNLYMRTGFLRATEDGYQRLTEDGGRRITE